MPKARAIAAGRGTPAGHEVAFDVVGEDLDRGERIEGVDGVEVADHEVLDRARVDQLAHGASSRSMCPSPLVAHENDQTIGWWS